MWEVKWFSVLYLIFVTLLRDLVVRFTALIICNFIFSLLFWTLEISIWQLYMKLREDKKKTCQMFQNKSSNFKVQQLIHKEKLKDNAARFLILMRCVPDENYSVNWFSFIYVLYLSAYYFCTYLCYGYMFLIYEIIMTFIFSTLYCMKSSIAWNKYHKKDFYLQKVDTIGSFIAERQELLKKR